MKSRYISILILLCIYSNALTKGFDHEGEEVLTDSTTIEQSDQKIELPPIFIGQHIPRFPIHGDAVIYSTTLHNMRNAVNDPQHPLYPIEQYTDQQLDFVARLINFLHEEEQKEGFISPGSFIAFIAEKTAGYRNIPFNQVLELINFFGIQGAFSFITAYQPLPLPKTPAQEVEYNKQLAYVFNLARSTTYREHTIAVGSEDLWRLFGRMLYPHCIKYPEIAQIIDFITAQQGGTFVRAVRTIGQRVGSWLGAPKSSGEITKKSIEQIVLEAYMQQYPMLSTHIYGIRKVKDKNATYDSIFNPVISPNGRIIAVENLTREHVELINIDTGKTIQIIKDAHSPTLSPDGQIIAVYKGHGTNILTLINIYTGETIGTSTHAFPNSSNLRATIAISNKYPYNRIVYVHGYASLREALNKSNAYFFLEAAESPQII